MVDITHKNFSLRKAVAMAVLQVSAQATIDRIISKTVPKGDVFEFSRAAGLLAVKKTSDVIPDCHPLPVEYTAIRHRVEGLQVIIEVEVHTIYKTGVEVEAMHGASVTALTMYDMLKPIDKSVEIGTIRLLNKEGGKTSFLINPAENLRCAVIVCSDSISNGTQEDRSGKRIIEKLNSYQVDVERYEVISDDLDNIQQVMRSLADDKFNLVIFTGGTGLSARDNTPEAIGPLIDREIPGIMEAARNYGQQRMPYAMLSRGVSGFVKNTLVLTLPGSVNGVVESMDAVFPYVFHIFRVAGGLRH
ncbi:MAG: bifunctional molybdenum cofactor biosynthesis protein MoaC/MoaB [Sphingobacteriales bacterium]|nr:MAG: bifunctional molybdenum cofactor biosynthesis protein MoaC/MoaB [Sphingobacteriales bacterium]